MREERLSFVSLERTTTAKGAASCSVPVPRAGLRRRQQQTFLRCTEMMCHNKEAKITSCNKGNADWI